MDGSHATDENDFKRWKRLTGKQRDCLDLLLERLTSKQIARELAISKYTVDQRIRTARNVLGAVDRGETARIYARLRNTYHRIAYDPVDIPPASLFVPSDFPDGDPSDIPVQFGGMGHPETQSGEGLPFGTIWRRSHGFPVRMTIMAAFLLFLVIILLGGLGIAQALTRLISG